VRKKTIALVVSVVLVLALLLSACTTETTPTQTSTPTTSTPSTSTPSTTAPPATQIVTQQIEKVYKVLNPQGSYIPVDCVGLADRLDTLAGKKILFYEAEATNMQMPTLLEFLKEDYPTTDFLVVYTELWGETVPTEEYLTCDACIRGIGW
jgi:ABC-type transport system substrate-binding protein